MHFSEFSISRDKFLPLANPPGKLNPLTGEVMHDEHQNELHLAKVKMWWAEHRFLRSLAGDDLVFYFGLTGGAARRVVVTGRNISAGAAEIEELVGASNDVIANLDAQVIDGPSTKAAGSRIAALPVIVGPDALVQITEGDLTALTSSEVPLASHIQYTVTDAWTSKTWLTASYISAARSYLQARQNIDTTTAEAEVTALEDFLERREIDRIAIRQRTGAKHQLSVMFEDRNRIRHTYPTISIIPAAPGMPDIVDTPPRLRRSSQVPLCEIQFRGIDIVYVAREHLDGITLRAELAGRDLTKL
ncbi:hypothetical protein SAMN04488523_12111 [Sulfitobacter brevis]|uniref:Uncharacterized protein n=1 Tax=Sulfitobacter brevis TaxID=74348 RepID=A0A1I2GBU3_9RHOB|nr:hypothetical protein [Sulfitobacter brevis]SFF14460.1 hypothetical protein SAMN04488523_12111 [Sulfitobacter brevis]